MDDRQARAVIENYRAATTCRPAVRSANWEATMARVALDDAQAATPNRPSSVRTWAIVGAVAAAAALVVWLARDGSLGTQGSAAQSHDQAVDDAKSTPPQSESEARVERHVGAAPAELVSTPGERPDAAPAGPNAGAQRVTRPRGAASAPAEAAAGATSPVPIDPAIEEAKLLARARDTLAAGDPSAALASLDRHLREYPQGVLAQERWILAVRAHCRLADGRAASVAAQFLAAMPGSKAATRLIAEPCPSEKP